MIVLVRPASPRVVAGLQAEIERDRRVFATSVGPPSRDGEARYVAVTFRGPTTRRRRPTSRTGWRTATASPSAARSLAGHTIGEQVQEDLGRAELIALPLLFLLSLWFFRSLVAALLPLMVGVVSILLTFLGLRVATS